MSGSSYPERVRRLWMRVVAGVVALVVLAAVAVTWLVGGFATSTAAFPTFVLGERVSAGSVAITVRSVGVADALPGRQDDPVSDYLTADVALRWLGNQGLDAIDVARVVGVNFTGRDAAAGAVPEAVLDADHRRLHTVNPGLDYDLTLVWPVAEGTQLDEVQVFLTAQHEESEVTELRGGEYSIQQGAVVRVTRLSPEDRR